MATASRPALWLAVDLPALPLQAWRLTLPAQQLIEPLALIKGARLGAVNEVAAARGLKPGMTRSTALALAPHTVFGLADAAREAQALQALAHAALAFTPAVTLHAARTVLLEVSTTLRAFGGLAALLARLQQALEPLGLRWNLASAPSARGAAWLARWQPEPFSSLCERTLSMQALQNKLDAMPLWLLSSAAEHHEAWQVMGLQCLSDVLALPRDGLARRFGEGLLAEIDSARGLRPEAHEWVTLPDRFEARLELMARADTSEQVLYGAHILLERLVAWAHARRGRVRRLTLLMAHEPRHRQDDGTPPYSRLDIEQAEPGNDAAHLQLLLRERLGRAPLPAPTLELRIHCHELALSDAPSAELFPTRASEHEGLLRLVERLQARLGRERVSRVVAVADYRPERGTLLLPLDAAEAVRAMQAQKAAPPAGRGPALSTSGQAGLAGALTRPLWLLKPAQALRSRQSAPCLEGHPLLVLAGPERIETGWWDGDPVARDYFIAQAHDGSLVWIYRSRLPEVWPVAQGDDIDDAEAPVDQPAQPAVAKPAASSTADVPSPQRGGGWFLHGRFA